MTRGTRYVSQVVMGERYRDSRTGFEGTVTSVTFFEHACERVALETFDRTQQQVRVEVFDAPRLVRVKTGEVPEVTKTGGPRMPAAQAAPGVRR